MHITNNPLLLSLLPDTLIQALRQPVPTESAMSAARTRLEATLAALQPFIPMPAYTFGWHGTATSATLLHGTVLCADLSGFTALSSHLAISGRQGSEEISALMNHLFAALMEEIEVRGGDVLMFGGDALTAFFNAADLGVLHTALACQTGLAMQERIADFSAVPTSRGPFRLRLRIAVHSGQVVATEIGDQNHADRLFAGNAIQRAASAQERAAPGRVVISAETFKAVPGARAEPILADLYQLRKLAEQPAYSRRTAPERTPEDLPELLEQIRIARRYAPVDLPGWMLQSNQVHGEFRPVTVLFTSSILFDRLLSQLEHDLATNQSITTTWGLISEYYARFRSVISDYGGSINKIDAASSGSRIVTLFGVPLVHEDDPARATRAALALRSTITDGYRQRAGVASGTVFAGMVGTDQRREYTVMGETVNLAARLLASAHDGDILLAPRTRRAARHIVEDQPLPAVFLKGFTRPFHVFRVLRERGVPGMARDLFKGNAPMVGRATELGLLMDVAGHVLMSEGHGQVVTISGDAGMGKSRLADESLDAIHVTMPYAGRYYVCCQAIELPTPYTAVGRMLTQLLHLQSDEDKSAQALRVQQRIHDLAPEWSRFTPLLAALPGLPFAETPLTQALTPEQRRDRLHDLVIMLCLKLARQQPFALVLDDLQWADASSLEIVGRLAWEISDYPLFLIPIYRPDPRMVGVWQDIPHRHTIHLNELTGQDSEALLEAFLGSKPPDELHPLFERIYGTPFFIEEMVRYLLESGTLITDGAGGWVCARPIDSRTLPVQVEQIIVARLDRLSEDARALAQLGAVIGIRFSKQLLVAAGPTELTEQLDELIDTGLIVIAPGKDPDLYEFRHALVHEVVYEGMLFAHRRGLHAQVARAIEWIWPEDRDDRQMMLAQHYLRADQPAHAFPHFVDAARQAQLRYANKEALALYHQAQKIAPWEERSIQFHEIALASILYTNLGDVLAITGDYDTARTSYQRLIGAYDHSNPSDAQVIARLQRKIGSTYEQQGIHEQARQWLMIADSTIAEAGSNTDVMLVRALIQSDIGWIAFRQGNMELAFERLVEAQKLIEPLDAYAEQAQILNRLGGVAWARGELDLAQYYVGLSLTESERSGDLIGQANALNNLGLITDSQGRGDESIGFSLQAIDINERIGNRRMLSIAANNIGWVLYNQGAFEQARDYFAQAIMHATGVNDTYNQMRALLNMGRVLMQLPDVHESAQIIQKSLAYAIQLDLPPEQLECYVALAEVALCQDDIPAAHAWYRQAEVLALTDETEEYGRFQRLAGKIALATGERERAIDLLMASLALFTRLYNAPEAEQTRRLLKQLQ